MRLREMLNLLDQHKDAVARVTTEPASQPGQGALQLVRGGRALLQAASDLAVIPPLTNACQRLFDMSHLLVPMDPALLTRDRQLPVFNEAYGELSHRMDVLRGALRIVVPPADDTTLSVELPVGLSLQDTSDVIGDLGKLLGIYIADMLGTEGGPAPHVVGVDSGSIWLDVGLGTIEALRDVGLLCTAALTVLKVKHYWQTIDRHGEALEQLIEARELALKFASAAVKESTKRQAQRLRAGKPADPEALTRAAELIDRMVGLMERGLRFFPTKRKEETAEVFPSRKEIEALVAPVDQGQLAAAGGEQKNDGTR